MTRLALDRREVQSVAALLRKRGHTVTIQNRLTGGHTPTPAGDLDVDGQAVAVLVSRTLRDQLHTVHVRGREYRYRYDRIVFNCAIRGQRRTNVDFWVLVWQHAKETRRYVVPAARIRCKTLRILPLHKLLKGTHWLCAYRDQWPRLVRGGKVAA